VPNRKKSGYEAPAAGAFGGVATLGLGEHIPETYPLIKYTVIYGSPIFSLIYTGLVQSGFIMAVASMKRREINRALKRVRQIRDEAYASGKATPAHLKDLQSTVENTEKLASQMATASDAAVVEQFSDISITDLMAKTTSALRAEVGLLEKALDPDAAPDEADAAKDQPARRGNGSATTPRDTRAEPRAPTQRPSGRGAAKPAPTGSGERSR
jgi:hypothetical protein